MTARTYTLDELRAIAEASTPGERRVTDALNGYSYDAGVSIAHIQIADAGDADAANIAAFDRARCLALIDVAKAAAAIPCAMPKGGCDLCDALAALEAAGVRL